MSHHRATRKTSLLDVACPFADHFCDAPGPAEEVKQPATDGCEEVERSRVEPAPDTGDQRYLAGQARQGPRMAGSRVTRKGTSEKAGKPAQSRQSMKRGGGAVVENHNCAIARK